MRWLEHRIRPGGQENSSGPEPQIMIPGSARRGATAPPPGNACDDADYARQEEPGIRRVSVRSRLLGAALVTVAALGPTTSRASAHGPSPTDPPTVASLALDWSFDPAVMLPLVAAVAAWLALVRRVDRAHPATPVPRVRTLAFLLGIAAIAIALQSGIERYDTTLFSIHMVQHLLLTLVAAPLFALSGPVTLLLRAATPATRRRLILPVLNSRVLRVASFPVVAWLLFAGVMWAAHFSPLFDIALENRAVHDLEHVLFLASALLFWWPAVGVDPAPWRLPHPIRVLYVFLQMPQNTFLAVVILNAPAALYPHYATLARSWGPSPLADQQAAGALMWVGGDLLFIAAIAAIIAGWMRHEDAEAVRVDRRQDAERASIRAREATLAARLADERAAQSNPTGPNEQRPIS
jgi:putative copper resistance protein D